MLENRIRLGRDTLTETGSMFVRCDYNGNMYVRLLMNEIFGNENFRNEIIVNRFKRQLNELTHLNIATETLLYYTKSDKYIYNSIQRKRTCTFCNREMDSDWQPMHSPGLRKPPERIILDKKLCPQREDTLRIPSKK